MAKTIVKFSNLELQKKRKQIIEKTKKTQKIGLPPTKEIGAIIWKELVDPHLLTHMQIAKKMILIAGQNLPVPIKPEDAQLTVYGKYYYKNGKLYDNDKLDPNCVASPDDKNIIFAQPLDEDNPTWKKIDSMIDDTKEALEQFAIKLGELLMMIPMAIATMITALISMISSLIILPFGSGVPTALTAVQTVIKVIKDLQAKISELLPHLIFLDYIKLILPPVSLGTEATLPLSEEEIKNSLETGIFYEDPIEIPSPNTPPDNTGNSQAAVAQISLMVDVFASTLDSMVSVTVALDKLMSAFDKAKTKSDESNELKVDPKADPSTITDSSKGARLTANAVGGDWNFTFKWTDNNGNEIPHTGGDDDGSRQITPQVSTTYKCRVTDGTGASSEAFVDVKIVKTSTAGTSTAVSTDINTTGTGTGAGGVGGIGAGGIGAGGTGVGGGTGAGGTGAGGTGAGYGSGAGSGSGGATGVGTGTSDGINPGYINTGGSGTGTGTGGNANLILDPNATPPINFTTDVDAGWTQDTEFVESIVLEEQQIQPLNTVVTYDTDSKNPNATKL